MTARLPLATRRAQQLDTLSARYVVAMRGRHWKLATELHARMVPIRTAQIKAENKDRKAG